MTPLSGLQSLWQGLPGTPLANPPTKPIPPAELEQLAPTRGTASAAPAQAPAPTFSSLLGRMVEEVNAKQANAAQAMQDFQAGQPVSLPQAMIAAEEASVSFQLMVEVRNKLLDAYQELMRMQV